MQDAGSSSLNDNLAFAWRRLHHLPLVTTEIPSNYASSLKVIWRSLSFVDDVISCTDLTSSSNGVKHKGLWASLCNSANLFINSGPSERVLKNLFWQWFARICSYFQLIYPSSFILLLKHAEGQNSLSENYKTSHILVATWMTSIPPILVQVTEPFSHVSGIVIRMHIF